MQKFIDSYLEDNAYMFTKKKHSMLIEIQEVKFETKYAFI